MPARNHQFVPSFDARSSGVTGTGGIYNMPSWYSVASGFKTVIIESGITGIGLSAFAGCTALTKVVLPDTLTTIGMSAFYGCTALTDVYYNATEAEFGLIEIGQSNEALMNAAKHFETAAVFTLPAALRKIDAEAFMGIPAEVIIVPATVTEIGSRAFANCPKLRKIIFLGTPASIAEDYLAGCEGVEVTRP